jgi:hypothetical protein
MAQVTRPACCAVTVEVQLRANRLDRGTPHFTSAPPRATPSPTPGPRHPISTADCARQSTDNGVSALRASARRPWPRAASTTTLDRSPGILYGIMWQMVTTVFLVAATRRSGRGGRSDYRVRLDRCTPGQQAGRLAGASGGFQRCSTRRLGYSGGKRSMMPAS